MVERDPDLVGTVSVAEKDWELVVDEFAAAPAAAGPADGWPRFAGLAEGHLTRGCFGSMLRMIAALPLPNQ